MYASEIKFWRDVVIGIVCGVICKMNPDAGIVICALLNAANSMYK